MERNGKTYIMVKDYDKMRQGVGMLLAELMRIKAEGDYDAIKALVDQYGVHFDPTLRDQVVARYKKLGPADVLDGHQSLARSEDRGEWRGRSRGNFLSARLREAAAWVRSDVRAIK